MNARQALAFVHRAANGNQVNFSSHALARMHQRGATRRDVTHALTTATSARWQADHESWLIEEGVDLDGDELSVACVIENGVLVVTIY